MIKKTLLAVAITTAIFSVQASANNNVRATANGAMSASTEKLSVGHRPVQLNHGDTDKKQVTVLGNLTVGSTLTLDDIAFSDNENDDLSWQGIQRSRDGIKWYLVNTDNEAVSGTPAGTGRSFTIPADAVGKKIRLVYRIHTTTHRFDGPSAVNSNPSEAFELSSVLLNTATSGLTAPDGNTDGTIGGQLVKVQLAVKYAATGPGAAPSLPINGTNIHGTPVVGSTLEAQLSCANNPADLADTDCGDVTTKYEFQWQMAEEGSTDFIDIASATAMTYQVRGDQQNKLFQVVVRPKTTKSNAPAAKAKRR